MVVKNSEWSVSTGWERKKKGKREEEKETEKWAHSLFAEGTKGNCGIVGQTGLHS